MLSSTDNKFMICHFDFERFSIESRFPLFNSHCTVGFYFTWPLRKHAAYKQVTRGPTGLVLSEGLGNVDKVPCPVALLPLPTDSNRGPHKLRVRGLIH